MKRIFTVVLSILLLTLFTVSTSATNFNTYNGVTFYIPDTAYEDYQLGQFAYRPRFLGTWIASNTGEVRGDEKYHLMNYFPIPTNWYGYNGGLFYGEESFLAQPTNILDEEHSYKRVYYVDTQNGDNNVLSMQMGGFGLDVAPDLYFDGLLGLYYNDGYCIRINNMGEVPLYLGFKGVIYCDYGTSYETHEYENAFILTPEDNATSIDSLIRADIQNYYNADCNLYFLGTFCAMANNIPDIIDGAEHKLQIDLYGDNASLTYVNGEITQDATNNSLLTKFTRVVSYGSDNANPTPSGTLDILTNGVYNVAQYANVDVNVPQDLEWGGLYDWLIGSFNAFTSFEIAPGWSIGIILSVFVGLAVIMWILKIFLGG